MDLIYVQKMPLSISAKPLYLGGGVVSIDMAGDCFIISYVMKD